MKNTSVQSLLKPNIASVGFGLFLSICAIGVWGGVFPFLPAEIQTEQMLLAFFIAQATTFTLSFFLGAVNTYYFPRPRVQVLVASMGIPLFIGWLCLIGILYLESYALALVIIGGVLLGFGSAGFFVLWHDIFASEPNEVGERELLVGSIYSPLFYVLFYLINQEIIMWVVTFVLTPLLCICVLVKAKDFNRAQPMFEDAPLSLPRIYRQVMQDFWRSALALGVIGFCSGILRSGAFGASTADPLVNTISMLGSLVAAIVLLIIWYYRGVKLNILAAYRFFFPVLATFLVILPLLGDGYLSDLYRFFGQQQVRHLHYLLICFGSYRNWRNHDNRKKEVYRRVPSGNS